MNMHKNTRLTPAPPPSHLGSLYPREGKRDFPPTPLPSQPRDRLPRPQRRTRQAVQTTNQHQQPFQTSPLRYETSSQGWESHPRQTQTTGKTLQLNN